jgi:hypothetical protein
VGPRTGLDAVVKRKIPSPCRDSTITLSYPGSSWGGGGLVLFVYIVYVTNYKKLYFVDCNT